MQMQKEAEEKHLAEQAVLAEKDSVAIVAELQKDSIAKLDSIMKAVAKVESTTIDSTSDSLAAAQIIVPKSVVFSTNKYDVTVSNLGAKITSVILKDLQDSLGGFPELIQNKTMGVLGFALGSTDFNEELFYLDSNLTDTMMVTKVMPLTLTWEQDGRQVIRTLTFFPDSFAIAQDLIWKGFGDDKLSLAWAGGMKESEPGAEEDGSMMGSNFFSEVAFKTNEGVFREMEPEEEMTYPEEKNQKVSWVGLRRKYVAGIFDFPKALDLDIRSKPLLEDSIGQPTYSLDIEPQEKVSSFPVTLRFLALNHEYVKSLGKDFDQIIFSGYSWFLKADVWFPPLCGWMLGALNFLGGLFANYGLAIIVLTLFVKFATLPLTVKQMRSMREMQKHKPALDKLRKKHKGDPAKYQQEMMAYYKKNGVNPLGGMMGCLPMLLQMPVFISLYVTLRYAVELRGADFTLWISDLSQPDVIFSGIQVPIFMPMGLTILPILMSITMYYQMKPTMTNPEMKAMLWIMPVMMFAFSGMMPSGLVLYWTVSNVFGIFQYKVLGTTSVPGA
jgi:YidC/Oxa1 family membrane protein insertase